MDRRHTCRHSLKPRVFRKKLATLRQRHGMRVHKLHGAQANSARRYQRVANAQVQLGFRVESVLDEQVVVLMHGSGQRVFHRDDQTARTATAQFLKRLGKSGAAGDLHAPAQQPPGSYLWCSVCPAFRLR